MSPIHAVCAGVVFLPRGDGHGYLSRASAIGAFTGQEVTIILGRQTGYKEMIEGMTKLTLVLLSTTGDSSCRVTDGI